jgi:hypothetical protein
VNSELGFRQLTLENWLQFDPTSAKLILDNAGATTKTIEVSDAYARDILEHSVSDAVPIEVAAMLEVAKGAMIYGYFFYPLFSVGLEHICKVAEAAIRAKCQTINAPSKVKTFEERIDYLGKTGMISEDTRRRWHKLRHFRNSVSHPQWQTIYTPGMALGILPRLVDDLNQLFGGGGTPPEQPSPRPSMP